MGNRVYDLNRQLNDILLTHEGDSSGDFHYGHSFGTQTIPMTNGQIKMKGCMGHSRGTTYVTIEVYGYIPADSKDIFFMTPSNLCTRGRGCRTTKLSVPLPSRAMRLASTPVSPRTVTTATTTGALRSAVTTTTTATRGTTACTTSTRASMT